MDTEEFFRLTASDLNCNTSYPIRRSIFSVYRSDEDIMKDIHELSLYYHIPFCRHLCRFCEYTRFLSDNEDEQLYYISRLIAQAEEFFRDHPIKKLFGLDIGGGTPTALAAAPFSLLLEHISHVISAFGHGEAFIPSIEFSFATLDGEKLRMISESPVQRMSTGIQVFDNELMESMDRRHQSLIKMERLTDRIKNSNIDILNLDIMYGFNEQTEAMMKNTIFALRALQPEQVTLYEMRYNRNNLPSDSLSRESLFRQYEYFYNELTDMGYKARFGQNTFSMNDDEGVSSYLYSRMFRCAPYKGFGISAQSMSPKGISYNIFKSSDSIRLPEFDKIIADSSYMLPPVETAAKYICISLYSGRFDTDILRKILKCDPFEHYKEEFNFLLKNGYISMEGNICCLTRKGFMYYGAVGALFWSGHHKNEYLKLR